MSIMIPTFLQMCDCGKHGHFMFPNGTPGIEFTSKEEAQEELERLHDKQSITEHELRFLMDCISEQDLLPGKKEEVDLVTRIACGLRNHIREQCGDIHEEGDEGETSPRVTIH